MNHKINLFTMLIALGTTNINAEATRIQPTCKTEPQCTKLSDTLRVQIGVLEAKGIENLTEKEFNRIDSLQDKLSAVQDSMIMLAKAKTAAQKKKIVEMKAKTAAMKAKTAAQKKKIAEMRTTQKKKLAEIRELLNKESSN